MATSTLRKQINPQSMAKPQHLIYNLPVTSFVEKQPLHGTKILEKKSLFIFIYCTGTLPSDYFLPPYHSHF